MYPEAHDCSDLKRLLKATISGITRMDTAPDDESDNEEVTEVLFYFIEIIR